MKTRVTTAALIAAMSFPLASFAETKNVILMVADGAGFNTHKAAEYWNGSATTYETDSSFTMIPTATYNLRQGADLVDLNGDPIDALAQDPYVQYDTAKAWDTTVVDGGSEKAADSAYYDAVVAGYEWLRTTSPDSAGTMTAMMTGVKTYRGAINVDGAGNELVSAAEVAKANGKMVGSISTVRYNHATVATGAGAHNDTRNDYLEISYEMFSNGIVDVIGGAGNPEFDDDGQASDRTATADWSNTRFDEALWTTLKSGTGTASMTTDDGRDFTVDGSSWQLATTKSDIEALAAGTATVDAGKGLVMIPEVYGTLQYSRSGTGNDGAVGNNNPANAYQDPFNDNVPDLSTMTKAALNALDADPDGFFLSIEGGAVDWADHGDDTGRMIEEMNDFDNAVQTVIDYLDAGTNGNDWTNTLLIITADHDHLFYGPDSDNPDYAFQDITDNGAGNLPGFFHHSRSHGNQLIPTWFRGPDGSWSTDGIIDGNDTVYGDYIHQAGIGQILLANVPEPSSLALLGLGGLIGARRRRFK